jgi:DNA replication protein DnaC
VLAFGLPGRGKTHLVAAIGHELVMRGYKVLFLAAFQLVQHLLLAKRALGLEKELRRLDAFDAVILDDIGYIQQDREEMVSQWDRIFKDPMTTAAAIDRLVHHATILELTGESYRSDAAKKRLNDNYPGGEPTSS